MPAKKLIHAVLTVYVCALLACCAGCTAAPAASPASTSGSSAAAEAPSPAADAAPVLADCPVSHSPKSDGVLIEASVADFNALGFAFGDSVDVAFSNGYALEGLPYYSGTLVEPGEALLLGSSALPYIEAGVSYGDDLWATAGLSDGDTATVTLAEPGAYADLQKALDLSYTDERADYPSDVAFANFRELKGGNLKPGKFYRGASPVNDKHNRAAYANALIADAGVRVDFDLADNEGEIEGFLEEDGQTGIDVSHFEGLRNAGDVVAIDLDAAYLSERYGQKLAAGLGELMQHDGPVYIHCTAGKDRTGFVCMLLEALAGASYQQIADDYMITYDNYYHVNEANDAERFNIIKEQRLDSMLRHVIGAEIGADLANADLSAGARNYLKAAGMTDEQINQLTAYLCA
ncbi:MAG: tyrosine-protein phosphatase [Eggerthellaceae bacterium]|nr:tyrosine-protein phosphatase [Eggerthellaceae bacterium]